MSEFDDLLNDVSEPTLFIPEESKDIELARPLVLASDLEDVLSRIRKDIFERKGARDNLDQQVQILKSRLSELEEGIQVKDEALAVMRDLVTNLQGRVKHDFESVVTRGLGSLWSEDVRFVVNFDEKRGKMSAEFGIQKSDGEVRPLGKRLGTESGGFMSVISLLCRLTLLIQWVEKLTPFLFMDEPLRALDDESVEVLGEFLQRLRDKFGFQFVICSHCKPLINIADVVIERKRIEVI